MGQVLHGCAHTTEVVRRAIQHSQKSLNDLAEQYGINRKTVAKWKTRGFANAGGGPTDCPDRPCGRAPRLDAGRADQGKIIVSVDPLALSQLLEQGAVETTRTAIIDVFDAGLLAQFGDAQPRREALVLPP
jgi:hypothetical protein